MVIWVKIFKTEKTIEIQLVRLTEVCGKVLSGRYNTSLGLYGIYCQGEAETNIAHTDLDKLLYLT